MQLDESARLYLVDYYLLDQARSDAHRYLEEIARQLAESLQGRMKQWDGGPITYTLEAAKGGGYVAICARRQDDSPDFPAKYYVIYRDAMTTPKLSNTTNCRVFGWSPKSQASQAAALQAVATRLGLPELYANQELDLLGAPIDEVVEVLASLFATMIDTYARTVQGTAGA